MGPRVLVQFWEPVSPGDLVSTSPVWAKNWQDENPIATPMHPHKGGIQSQVYQPQFSIFLFFSPARVMHRCHVTSFSQKGNMIGRAMDPLRQHRTKVEHYELNPHPLDGGTSGMDAV